MKQTEALLQQAVCKYITLQYPDIIFASDLSGVKLSIGVAKKLKMLKSEKGIPDLTLYEPRKGYHGLCIELKRDGVKLFKKDGITYSDPHYAEQAEVLSRLSTKGYLAVFCIGWDQARGTIDGYLGK